MSDYLKLPDCLKSCFDYCCCHIRYSIEKDELVRVLVAEGLISERPEEAMEDSIEKMIDELIELCLLQDSHIARTFESYLRAPRSCNDQLSLIQADQQQDFVANSPVRVVIEDDGKNIPPDFENLQIRSLLLITVHQLDRTQFQNPGISGSYLRTVCSLQNLEILEIQGKLAYLPDEVGDLVQLKYLRLSWCYLDKLPGRIGNLQKLQTLDVRKFGNLRKLPEEVVRIRHLRHLLMSRTTRPGEIIVPKKIGTLVNLRTLTGVNTGDGIASELGTLVQLRKLSVQASEDQCSELSAAIMKMTNLISLSLEGETTSIKAQRYGLLPEFELFSPPPLLQNVRLLGILVDLPSWLALVNNLTSLCLSYSNLVDYTTSFLQRLPKLKHLGLFDSSKATIIGREFCEAGGFAKLERLKIVSRTLIEWTDIVEGSFASLRGVYFIGCTKLRFLPEGLQNISTLEELIVMPAHGDLTRRLRGEEHYKVKNINRCVLYESSHPFAKINL